MKNALRISVMQFAVLFSVMICAAYGGEWRFFYEHTKKKAYNCRN